MRLRDRSIIVTGASRGIGLAISQRLAREGAQLLMTDIDEEPVNAAAKEVGSATGAVVVAECGDITSLGDNERIAGVAVERFGHIDALVNNAGAIQIKPWALIEEPDWDRMFDVNLKGTFLMCQVVASLMREQGGGRIVNLSSNAARGRASNSLHYGAAKQGVIYLTQTLAKDLGPANITVNAVAPGVVSSTALWDEIGAGYEQHFGLDKAQRVSALVEQLPLRRPQTPEDIAAAVAFLLSDDASEITGVCLDIDGGASL